MKTAARQTQRTNPTRTAPRSCKAAVFERPNQPLSVRSVPIPTRLEAQAILCKVRLSTICGSDLHTVFGRRPEPAPSILGHEIVGEIVDFEAGGLRDFNGASLTTGDCITWSIAASCRRCRYCRRGLPQKCVNLRKYGHLSLDEPPHVTGGYAEYICIMPGTALFKVPADLPDDVMAPANCTLATAQNAVATLPLASDDTVLIQGAGLLGLYLCALAKSKRCTRIVVTDIDSSRLDMAERFGATHCFCARDCEPAELARRIRESCPGDRLTTAFEACGAAEAPKVAVDALDIGGRYLLVGLVRPNSLLNVDANQVIRKYLTISGIHNYDPTHLKAAVEFLQTHQAVFPFDAIVGRVFPLGRINEAIAEASSGRHIRVGVRP
jgi:alcohol dehydrogenase